MTPFQLIDACCEAYDNKNFIPKDGETHCNQAVAGICDKYGYPKFRLLLANEMIDLMRSGPEWAPVSIEEAQNLANQGKLVVAGRKDEPHGHVAVVRPGVPDYSPKWGCLTPKVVNIGAENFIDKSLSWIFREKPEVFSYKG